MRYARHVVSLGLCCALALGSAVAVTAKDPSGPGWTQFHGSWTRSGFDPDETILGPKNVGGLAASWSTDLGQSLSGSPVISMGRVFVGGYDGTLYALRTSDGRGLWSREIGASNPSTPGLWRNLVIVGAGGYLGSRLAAFSAASGAPRWTADVPGDISMSSPTVVGDSVYVANQDGAVFAYSARTGTRRWSTETSSAPWTGIAGPLAVSTNGSLVFAAATDGWLYALRSDTGGLQWKARAGGGVYRGGPAVSGGVVYVPNGTTQAEGGGFTMSAFRLANGVKRWTAADVGDDVHTTPAVGYGSVYIGAIDGSVHATDARTGALRWVAQLEHEIWSSAALANGVLYVATESSLVALEAATGVVLFNDDLDTGGSAEMTSPAIADGRIYIGSGNSLMAFALP